MATLRTKFSVGLFLIVGVAIIIVGVVWFGMSGYMQKGRLWVAYFDESVQGLDRDSAVKYRGVNVGRVYSIGIAPDENLIEVLMQIDVDVEFESQIAAQLKTVGITGLVFIELDRIHEDQVLIYPPPTFEPLYPVVPTQASEMTKFFKGVDEVFATLRALDTQAISDELVIAIQKVNQAIDDIQPEVLGADIRSTVNKMGKVMDAFERTSNSIDLLAANADSGIDEIRQVVVRLERLIESSGEDIQEITTELKQASRQIKNAAEGASALIENSDRTVDGLQRQTMQALTRIDQAGDTLNRFLDRIVADPSQLFFGGSQQVEKPAAP
jgi:phospholipid/cholesterol/gamma-HCH transport system substrate-binding protein